MSKRYDHNVVNFTGRLTRDPETRVTTSGTKIVGFAVAVQTGEEASFIDCTAFNKTGEIVEKFFSKGNRITVVGSLRQESWTDKNTGQKRSKLGVVANNVHFVDPPSETNEATPADEDDDDKPAY